jgi:hypothetical protein
MGVRFSMAARLGPSTGSSSLVHVGSLIDPLPSLEGANVFSGESKPFILEAFVSKPSVATVLHASGIIGLYVMHRTQLLG